MKESRGGKQLAMEKKRKKKKEEEQCSNNDPSKMSYKKKNRFALWWKLVSERTWIEEK